MPAGSSATAAALAALQGGPGGGPSHQGNLTSLLRGPLGNASLGGASLGGASLGGASLLRPLALGGGGGDGGGGLGMNMSPALLQELMAASGGQGSMQSLRPSVLSLGPGGLGGGGLGGGGLRGGAGAQLEFALGASAGAGRGASFEGLTPQQLSQLGFAGHGALIGMGDVGGMGAMGRGPTMFSGPDGSERAAHSSHGMSGGSGGGGAAAGPGPGAGSGSRPGGNPRGDMFAAISSHLPRGAALDSIIPSGNPDVVGVLFSVPDSNMTGAGEASISVARHGAGLGGGQCLGLK